MGVGWGQLCVSGRSGEGICLPNACPAILPGSQSELHPAPPSFPWKHGSKGKGYNSCQVYPHPIPPPLKKNWNHGPYTLQSAEVGLSHTCP